MNYNDEPFGRFTLTSFKLAYFLASGNDHTEETNREEIDRYSYPPFDIRNNSKWYAWRDRGVSDD